MIKQIINVGSDPGDQGDGDTLRDAFLKTQANFDELFPVTDVSLEHDNPSVGGTIAKALADAGAAGGGTVLVGPGTFQCPNTTLTIPENVIIRGTGRRATRVQCLHSGNGIEMSSSFSGVESLSLSMPDSRSPGGGDGIVITQNINHLRDLSISGGNLSTWAINCDAVNIIRIELVQLGALSSTVKPDTLTGNGIIFQNTRPADRPFNYGDSMITSADIHLFTAGATGIKLHGPDDTTRSINNVLLSKVEIHGGSNVKQGSVGVHLQNARRNTLLHVDLEAMETGIIEEHTGAGNNWPVNNSYIATFALGIANSYVSSGEVRDRTFIGCDKIQPDLIGDADALFPRSIWISNGDLRIKQTGGRFQLDNGNDANGLQIQVDSPAPTIRTSSKNTDAKITLGQSDTAGVECIPGIVLPPQLQPVASPEDGMLVYYSAGVIGVEKGLYQYRDGSWLFIK